MKKAVLISLSSLMLSNLAIANTTTTTSLETAKKNFLSKAELTLETEYSQDKDGGKIVGSESYIQVEPGYKLSKKSTLSLGAVYKVRENNTESERKNRDHLDEVFVKFLHKPTKFKNNGIADVRLQARIYQSTDSFFREFYGNSGNYQVRAYFGRPLIGNTIYLNKYTSYVRYKKYLANNNASKYSRDYELRAQVSPTYRINDSLEASAGFRYNHVFSMGVKDEEELTLSPSLRYSMEKGKYAVMLRAGFPLMEDDSTGELTKSVDNLEDTTYALTFSAYL